MKVRNCCNEKVIENTDVSIIQQEYNYFINSPWSIHSNLRLDELIDIYNSSNLKECLQYIKRHNSYCYHKDEYYAGNL